MKATIDGPSYLEILGRFGDEVTRANAVIVGSDGTEYPRLSNGELVAAVQAWKRCAARSKTPAWGMWYDLVLSGLGWEKDGDRFDMSDAHIKAPADPAAVELFWQEAARLAAQLDDVTTKLAPLIVDWSRKGYGAAAREAWRKMVEDGKAPNVIPPLPPSPPTSPVNPPIPTLPTLDGDGLLIALLIAAAVLSRKNRRS